jgi:hypothetical protein
MATPIRSHGVPRWLRLAALAAAALWLNAAGGWATGLCDFREWIAQDGLVSAVVCAATAAYVVAMALPFIPGIEIGLALMLVLGVPGVVLVYASTQLALVLSYLLGRLVPRAALARGFALLGMQRAQRLVAAMEAGGAELLGRRAPSAWARILLRNPGLALAALLNLPGNAVIGGAGGIGMIAGASRLFSFPRYVLLIAAATTPVPIFLLLGDRL